MSMQVARVPRVQNNATETQTSITIMQNLLEMSPPDVFLDVGANVHCGVATRPGTLIYDAHMLSLKQKERERG